MWRWWSSRATAPTGQGYLAVPRSGSGAGRGRAPGVVGPQRPDQGGRATGSRRRASSRSRPTSTAASSPRARRSGQVDDGAQHRAGGEGHGGRGRLPRRARRGHVEGRRRRRVTAWAAALALWLATLRPDAGRAVVPYYGVVPWPARSPTISVIDAPVQGHYAENDDFAGPPAVAALEEQLTARASRTSSSCTRAPSTRSPTTTVPRSSTRQRPRSAFGPHARASSAAREVAPRDCSAPGPWP